MERRIHTCEITVVAGRKKLCDPDNVVVKFALDAIKGEGGFIQDDNAAIITSLLVRQEKTKTPYTEIIIEFDDEITGEADKGASKRARSK